MKVFSTGEVLCPSFRRAAAVVCSTSEAVPGFFESLAIAEASDWPGAALHGSGFLRRGPRVLSGEGGETSSLLPIPEFLDALSLGGVRVLALPEPARRAAHRLGGEPPLWVRGARRTSAPRESCRRWRCGDSTGMSRHLGRRMNRREIEGTGGVSTRREPRAFVLSWSPIPSRGESTTRRDESKADPRIGCRESLSGFQ